jgi:hypothetical protein
MSAFDLGQKQSQEFFVEPASDRIAGAELFKESGHLQFVASIGRLRRSWPLAAALHTPRMRSAAAQALKPMSKS